MHFGGGSRRGSPRLILDDVSDISQAPLPIAAPVPPQAAQQTQQGEPQTTELPLETLTPPPASKDPEEKKTTAAAPSGSNVRKQLFEPPFAVEQEPPTKKAKGDDPN